MQSKNREIIIGDVHGCLTELKLLIKKLKLLPSDNLYFIGDIIDRGNDSIGTIKFIINLSTYSNVILILGNHEEKFLRYIEKDKDLNNELFNFYKKSLNKDEIKFLRHSYYNYYIKKYNIMLIHGGYFKKIKLTKDTNHLYRNRKDQKFSLLTMVRYIDQNGSFVELNKNDENSSFWAEKYEGDVGKIIFGHQHFIQDSPKYFKNAIGIDNGCVYGGWLTSLIINKLGIISHLSVKSLR